MQLCMCTNTVQLYCRILPKSTELIVNFPFEWLDSQLMMMLDILQSTLAFDHYTYIINGEVAMG